MYSSKHRPSRLPPNCVVFSFSRRIKAMTLRLHRCKSGWLNSNGNHNWFIYWIICPICRLMSKLESYFIWQYNAFERCIVKWSLDWKLDIRRQMGQMVQYMNQVWALLVRHHHILRLWTLYFIPSLHRETHSIHQFWRNRFGRMWMIICPNMDKKWSFLVLHMHVRLELIIFYPYFGI